MRKGERLLPGGRALGVLLTAAIQECEGDAGLAHRVQIDRDIGLLNDVRPEKMDDPLRQAAAGIARPQLVNVAGERNAFACRVMRRHACGVTEPL